MDTFWKRVSGRSSRSHQTRCLQFYGRHCKNLHTTLGIAVRLLKEFGSDQVALSGRDGAIVHFDMKTISRIEDAHDLLGTKLDGLQPGEVIPFEELRLVINALHDQCPPLFGNLAWKAYNWGDAYSKALLGTTVSEGLCDEVFPVQELAGFIDNGLKLGLLNKDKFETAQANFASEDGQKELADYRHVLTNAASLSHLAYRQEKGETHIQLQRNKQDAAKQEEALARFDNQVKAYLQHYAGDYVATLKGDDVQQAVLVGLRVVDAFDFSPYVPKTVQEPVQQLRRRTPLSAKAAYTSTREDLRNLPGKAAQKKAVTPTATALHRYIRPLLGGETPFNLDGLKTLSPYVADMISMTLGNMLGNYIAYGQWFMTTPVPIPGMDSNARVARFAIGKGLQLGIQKVGIDQDWIEGQLLNSGSFDHVTDVVEKQKQIRDISLHLMQGVQLYSMGATTIDTLSEEARQLANSQMSTLMVLMGSKFLENQGLTLPEQTKSFLRLAIKGGLTALDMHSAPKVTAAHCVMALAYIGHAIGGNSFLDTLFQPEKLKQD